MMELLRKLLRNLARKLKDVKETSMGNNVPETAVIREPVEEYSEQGDVTERRIGLEGDDDNENRVRYRKRKINITKSMQQVYPSYWGLYVY